MAPVTAFGLDFMSALAVGAAGVVASAALYALSGGKKKEEATASPSPAATPAAKTSTSVDESKLTKKQRQKLNKQKKRTETPTIIEAVASVPKVAVNSSTDSDDAASPIIGKAKSKKKSKKNKSKKQELTGSTDDVSTAASAVDDSDDTAGDDDDVFALALAGNQKNMQQMRNDKKAKQQKETEKSERRKAAEEREKRVVLKEEERVRAAEAVVVAEQTGQPKQETTIIALKPRQVQIMLGQGGKVIKQIRSESGARLDVSKREDEAASGPKKDRRLLTLVGTSDQIAEARNILRGIFKEENDKSQVVDVGDKMSAVIGKGGSVIRRIMEETGATLDADRDGGSIRVSGEPEQIEAAVTAIKKISTPGDQISMKINKRQKMLVIGKGGEMIRKIEERTHCQLDVEKTEDGGGLLKIGGDSTQVLEAMKTVQKLFHEASFSVTVSCGDLIGAVMGKGGEVIRKIQEDIQVKLDVEMDKKCVVIIGYEKDVLKAKERIEGILACPVEVKAGEIKVHVDLGTYVSSVIGRGGSKVREIEESSGAIVKVLGTECIIVGKQKNVENAKRQVDEIVKKQVEASARNEQAIAAVQALSESYNTAPAQAGSGVPWGSSAWGNDIPHWTPAPVAATR